MGILSPFKPKALFSDQESSAIVEAIREAEKRTSGEVRVYIESHCKYVNPLDRAVEIFYALKMNNTAERNAVLVYVAIKDHQLALFADEGIHAKTGQQFWKEEVALMLSHFNTSNYSLGIEAVVKQIGEALHQHFPYNGETDKNELPDDIVFGR
ncbi:MAG: TPM domain-containing protein [Williamsia sp.]|nr:TPM domain-containing protein [Williamsia sp.]